MEDLELKIIKSFRTVNTAIGSLLATVAMIGVFTYSAYDLFNKNSREKLENGIHSYFMERINYGVGNQVNEINVYLTLSPKGNNFSVLTLSGDESAQMNQRYLENNKELYSAKDEKIEIMVDDVLSEDDILFFWSGGGPVPDYVKLHQFISSNVSYLIDPGQNYGLGYMKHPLVTLKEGKGDCEDYSSLLSSLLGYTNRSVLSVWEDMPGEIDHVTLAIGLYDGEEVPYVNTMLIDDGFMNLKKLNPDLENKSIEEVIQMYPELFVNKKKYAFTFEFEGQRYFLIESTASNPNDFLRENISPGHQFNKIY